MSLKIRKLPIIDDLIVQGQNNPKFIYLLYIIIDKLEIDEINCILNNKDKLNNLKSLIIVENFDIYKEYNA